MKLLAFLNFATTPLAFAAWAFVYGIVAQWQGYSHNVTITLTVLIAVSFCVRRLISTYRA